MQAFTLKIIVASLLGGLLVIAQAQEITGAGATFPAPLYAKWADAYYKVSGKKINYQSIGSSGGIRQIKAKTVDFGASDAPLKQDELDKDGMIQFPTAMGGVVPVVNLVGVQAGQLRLTPTVLAEIYLGNISKWNDKALMDLNPGVKLPDQSISVVRRADGSGTTFIFTNYLSKVSAEWKQRAGEGTTVNWPVGLGGKGNEGVAAFIQRIPGAIGYVEYSYVKKNKLAFALLQNKSGNFVAPDDLTFKAAAVGAKWHESFAQILTDQAGKEAWPITGATFILLYKNQDKPQQAVDVFKFFDWAYENGDKMAEELDYVPMPEAVTNLIRTLWANTVKDPAGKAIYSK